jgi:hypothetical protein
MALINIVVANITKDAKDFFVAPLRDEVVGVMPSAEKRAEYAAIAQRGADYVKYLTDAKAPPVMLENVQRDTEKQLADYCRVWFKGTVFDACYSPLKKARAAGDAKFQTELAEMKAHAVGAPADTLGADIRAICAEFKIAEADIRAKVREALAMLPQTSAQDVPQTPAPQTPAPQDAPQTPAPQGAGVGQKRGK